MWEPTDRQRNLDRAPLATSDPLQLARQHREHQQPRHAYEYHDPHVRRSK